MNWLTRYNVKLLLHGHKHKSFVAQVVYPKKPTEDIASSDALHKITIVGMGGTGAKNTDNKLAMIAFEGSEVTIQFYRLHNDQISEDALDQKVKIQL